MLWGPGCVSDFKAESNFPLKNAAAAAGGQNSWKIARALESQQGTFVALSQSGTFLTLSIFSIVTLLSLDSSIVSCKEAFLEGQV